MARHDQGESQNRTNKIELSEEIIKNDEIETRTKQELYDVTDKN